MLVLVTPIRWRVVLGVFACAGLATSCGGVHRSQATSSLTTSTSTTHPAPSVTSTTVATSGNAAASALSAGLEVIACPAAEVCVAAGAEGFGTPGHEIAAVSTDGGSNWASTLPFPGVTHLSAMSCATPTSCVAVGWNLVGNASQGAAVSTANGGHTWTTVSDLPHDVTRLESIACPTAISCMAVGTSTDEDRGVALTTYATGSQWHALSLPNGLSNPSLVSCVTPQRCVIEGSKEAVLGDPSSGENLSIITTSDGGETWVSSALPTGTFPEGGAPDYKGLICPSASWCILIGDSTPGDGTPSGLIFASSDGGKTWTSVTPPQGTTFLNAVACPTTTDCVVVGGGFEARGGLVQDILTTDTAGQAWVSRPVPTAVTELSSVSCWTSVSCVAVGLGPSAGPSGTHPVAAQSSNGGATWSAFD